MEWTESFAEFSLPSLRYVQFYPERLLHVDFHHQDSPQVYIAPLLLHQKQYLFLFLFSRSLKRPMPPASMQIPAQSFLQIRVRSGQLEPNSARRRVICRASH